MAKLNNKLIFLLLVFLIQPCISVLSNVEDAEKIESEMWGDRFRIRYRAIPFLIKENHCIYFENENQVVIRNIEDPYNQFLEAIYQLKANGGITNLVVDSDILFIYYYKLNDANSTDGIELVDISDIKNPYFLGSIEFPNYLGGSPNIIIQENYCYLIVIEEQRYPYYDPIYIIDFNKTCSPEIVGIYETPNQYILSFAILDDLMYVRTFRDSQLEIANISDKSSPRMIKAQNQTFGRIINVKPDTLIFRNYDEIILVDITKRTFPESLTSFRFEETEYYEDLESTIFWEDYCCLICTNHFEIYDISDRKNVVKLCVWQFDSQDFGYYVSGKVANNRLYLSRSSFYAEGTFQVFDIIDLSNPTLIFPANGENKFAHYMSPILVGMLIPGVFIFSRKNSRFRRNMETIVEELVEKKKKPKRKLEIPVIKKKLAKKLSEQEIEGYSFGIEDEEVKE